MNYINVILFVIAGLFFVLPLTAQDKHLVNGTLIITLTSEDTIWLGADSRTSTLSDKGYTINKEGMCKIYSTNNVLYAMAGHVRYVDNSFNFLNIMQTCINEQNDFEKSMELFHERATAEIRTILTKFSRRSVNTLIKTNNGSFLSVIAISFVNGEKNMKEMRFAIEATSNNNWNVTYKEAKVYDVGSLRFLGHATNVLSFVKDNKLYFGNGRNIPEKISDLIKLESAMGTITVGMPADVISIYNNGYKRVISSGLCQ